MNTEDTARIDGVTRQTASTPPPPRERRCCAAATDLALWQVGSRQRQAAMRGGRDRPRQAVRHGLRLVVADEVGVVVVCRCGRWGIATSTVEHAEEAYTTEHLSEMGLQYSRDDLNE
jgi:hypothetical protein